MHIPSVPCLASTRFSQFMAHATQASPSCQQPDSGVRHPTSRTVIAPSFISLGHARRSLAGTISTLWSDDAAHVGVELELSSRATGTREDNDSGRVGTFNFGEARFFWPRWTTKTRKNLPEKALNWTDGLAAFDGILDSA